MLVQWYAHLPGVDLASSDSVQIGRGSLATFAFDDWHRLDGMFAFNDRDYEQSRPVFYVGETDIAEDFDAAATVVGGWSHDLHLAFLLLPGAPLLPAPSMSVTYLRSELLGDEPMTVVRRQVGPLEREWIVFGSRLRVRLDDADLATARRILDLVRDFDPDHALPGVQAGLRALALTARPDFWWDDDGQAQAHELVHCVAALEHILIAPTAGRTNITEAFGQRAAVILTGERDSLSDLAEDISDIYRLRTRLIHGQVGLADLTDADQRRLLVGRGFLTAVIVALLELGPIDDPEAWHVTLARAYADPGAHQALFDRISEGTRQ